MEVGRRSKGTILKECRTTAPAAITLRFIDAHPHYPRSRYGGSSMTKTEVVHIVSDLCSSGEPILKADINLAACLGRLITVAMPYQIIHA